MGVILPNCELELELVSADVCQQFKEIKHEEIEQKSAVLNEFAYQLRLLQF